VVQGKARSATPGTTSPKEICAQPFGGRAHDVIIDSLTKLVVDRKGQFMSTPMLGRLEKVDDLRTAWIDEPSDFTPWLALLGKTE